MTKEQAIEVLHELDGSLYETQQVALDMAIKALEQQPNEDLINLVNEQEKWLSTAGYNAYNVDIAFKSIVKAIKESPVTPVHGTCKDCMHRLETTTFALICGKHKIMNAAEDFYCADFEKRGNEE